MIHSNSANVTNANEDKLVSETPKYVQLLRVSLYPEVGCWGSSLPHSVSLVKRPKEAYALARTRLIWSVLLTIDQIAG